jgi:hypothetical protein
MNPEHRRLLFLLLKFSQDNTIFEEKTNHKGVRRKEESALDVSFVRPRTAGSSNLRFAAFVVKNSLGFLTVLQL